VKLLPVKGTKDYLPEEASVREWIIDTLKHTFKLYGYKPIETSILDYWEIGANKYAGGDEILKETYRLTDRGGRDLILRYELTFKLAKLIGMHPNIRMPFKRYEIGKVFRDGPVKTGRLREFTQCDVDVVGTTSPLAEVELISMTFDVFDRFGIPVYIQVNNKKLQFGIFAAAGVKEDKYIDTALSLDKLVKFGKDYVIDELKDKGLDPVTIKRIFEIVESVENVKDNRQRIDMLESILSENPIGMEGLNELRELFTYCESLGLKDVVFLPSLSRGLGYYTGTVWEVYVKDRSLGITSSVAAGGRWDDMIGRFLGTERRYPATGMTFGLDVIYEVIKAMEKKGATVPMNPIPFVYVIPIGNSKEVIQRTLNIAKVLRRNDISSDVAYSKGVSKALDYASKSGIPYVIMIGEDEIRQNKLKLKDMKTGEETVVTVEEAVYKLKSS